MENNSPDHDDVLTMKAGENTSRLLLKELIKNVESFITQRELNQAEPALSVTLKRIFYHGLSLDRNGNPNIRRVFGALDFFTENSVEGQMKSFNKWLCEQLEKGKLTNLLSFLFSDTEHIKSCFEPSAFINNEAYQHSLMLCILAIETRNKSLITKIDCTLYDESESSKRPGGHRRASSHPHMSFLPRKSILSHMKKVSRTFDCDSEKVKVKARLRPWNSLPNLHNSTLGQRPRSKTINLHSWKLQKKVSFKAETEVTEAIPAGEEVPYFEYKDSMTSIKVIPATPVNLLKVDDIKIHTDYRFSPEYQKSPTSTRPKISTKKHSMFSFLEHTSDAVKLASSSSPNMSASPTDVFFSVAAVAGAKIQSTSPIVKSLEESTRKRKSSRQNLAYFLRTINSSSSRPKISLDRENAHFHLSEAIIATSQQLKWNKLLSAKYKIPKDVRIKDDLSSSPRRPIPPPPRSAKFIVGSIDDDSDLSLSNDETSTDKGTSSSEELNENIPQMEWNLADDPHSAESIAMILISKFKNQRLPNPNSLMWLVNESQAPQQLLPFPDSFTHHINPDEPFHLNTFIRGSSDWAPPRNQIIFTVHPPLSRKRQMQQQSNKCAGCGLKVQAAYMHTFRYCEYLGKLFCSACHKNQISAIPARVLDKFDFSLYPVSNFSYKWLDQIWALPLFHVADLNPQLYEKAKPLMRAREARLQLKFIQDFIEQCRFAVKEQGYCKEIPSHLAADDIDIWSMTDFVDIKNSVFTERISEIIKKLEEHVVKNHCELCTARGFFCESCTTKDVIFPWQSKVKRCNACGSCFHDKCFKSECSKCERLKRRKLGK